eukprot:CAMPEP_0185209176 /NCGR_PEP_ID=MMETSP1140-20130426/63325_1 /TAXON_ID=298111 /ORGANISM="Pavlova sp., Strain CCMP459" /LENGTH=82 /DNA_ID=CAMNT_0027776923 /DNA_START=1062 /DNA_END=1310 /DNA_ORIENTATION=+
MRSRKYVSSRAATRLAASSTSTSAEGSRPASTLMSVRSYMGGGGRGLASSPQAATMHASTSMPADEGPTLIGGAVAHAPVEL